MVALGSSVLVSLLVYAGRVVELFGDLRLFATSGGEGVIIHNVWKAAHGFQVYGFPDRDPFDITLYNYMFFFTYGRLAAGCGMDGDALVSFCRLLTLGSASLGAFAQWRILLLALGTVTRRESVVIVLLSILTWYGTFYMNWWLVSVRPDVPAVAMATVALWLFLLSLRGGNWRWLVMLAVILFYLAWSFKQSVVWMLTGAVAGAFFVPGGRRQALLLAIPTALAFAATLVVGTPEYRYQILNAPAMNRIIVGDSLSRLVQLIPPLALFWFFAALRLVQRVVPAIRRSLALPDLGSPGAIIWAILATIGALALVMGTIAIGKEGSGRNHLMEAVVVVSILAGIHLIQVIRAADSPARSLTLWLAVVMAGTLCLRPLNSLTRDEFSGMRGGRDADVERHLALAKVMRALPKPVFTRDDIQSQAWNSTAGDHPAVILDSVYYFAAKRAGALQGGGLPALFMQHRFRAILIAKSDAFFNEVIPAAHLAGYLTDTTLPPSLTAAGFELMVLPTGAVPQSEGNPSPVSTP